VAALSMLAHCLEPSFSILAGCFCAPAPYKNDNMSGALTFPIHEGRDRHTALISVGKSIVQISNKHICGVPKASETCLIDNGLMLHPFRFSVLLFLHEGSKCNINRTCNCLPWWTRSRFLFAAIRGVITIHVVVGTNQARRWTPIIVRSLVIDKLTPHRLVVMACWCTVAGAGMSTCEVIIIFS
jgi:hypothetical protein